MESKNTFKGFALGKHSVFQNGAACGQLVRLTQMYNPNAQAFEPILDEAGAPSSVVVDLIQGTAAFQALITNGLGPTAILAFEADGWFEHDPESDNVLEATDKYPETPIHRIAGLVSDSIVIVRKAKLARLNGVGDTAASAPASASVLQRMAARLGLNAATPAEPKPAAKPKAKAKVATKA